MKKKYNSAQLKICNERHGHPATSSDDIEGQGGTDFQIQNGKESSFHEISCIHQACFDCG